MVSARAAFAFSPRAKDLSHALYLRTTPERLQTFQVGADVPVSRAFPRY
jgi:hypothetical protein